MAREPSKPVPAPVAVQEQPERHFPVRTYQNRNLGALDFPYISEAPTECSSNGGQLPPLLPFFTKTTKYCTTAVLEESVIDNESLKHTPFLKSCDPRFVDELFKVEGCTRAIVHLPDAEIAHQGARADSLVVIVHGQVDVFVDGVKQRRLSDGDYFGVHEFLGVTTERQITARTVTFCDARVMYRSCLTRTLERCPAMKDDYPYLISVWRHKTEKDGMRFMKVFTSRCMECIDPPNLKDLTIEAPDSPNSVNTPKLNSPTGASNNSGSLSPGTSPRRIRKIGHAPLQAGKSIASTAK